MRGPAGLKQILHAQQACFVRNLASQLLTYALGRRTEYYDEVALTDITERLEKNDYRFSELVKGVVASRPFQYRKTATTKADVSLLQEGDCNLLVVGRLS